MGVETSEQIKVLWLIKGLGLGGAERLLVNALPYLNRDEYDYQVAYFLPWKDALVSDLERTGLPVTCLGKGSPLVFDSVRKVQRHLRDHSIDVLHAHLPWASIVGRIAARREKTPVVLYTEHGCWNRLNPLTRWANRRTLGMNDLTIAVSDEVRESITGVDADRILTIANGIDCAALRAVPDTRQAVRASLGIAADDFMIAKVANLIPVKNHEMLVRAFASFVQQYPKSTLVLVGQLRETTDATRALVAELGLHDHVVLTGPRTDVPAVVQAADVFAMSSRSEGLPISLLEAMALGKPVVCTEVGGIPGVVTEGVEGFLVPVNQPEVMAERFATLCATPSLRLRMGQAGQAKVHADYDIAVMVRAVEAEYRRLLARKAGERKVGER